MGYLPSNIGRRDPLALTLSFPFSASPAVLLYSGRLPPHRTGVERRTWHEIELAIWRKILREINHDGLRDRQVRTSDPTVVVKMS